jgi:lipopolysaccharide/colanic/teichoic acid biosynthesis glycosyltransferase
LFDIGASAVALILLAPIFLGLALAIALKLGRPVLFRQTRPGLHGLLFELVKFRSMTDARDALGRLLPDEERIPPFGAWLRSTSLDELPELLLVLRGKMSLVGPRPLLVTYLNRYTPEQARRHEALPGITGWAQVNGRNALTWEDKFCLDVWYVDHQSLWLDVKILFLTLWKALKREGINAPGSATAPEFMGSDTDIPQD